MKPDDHPPFTITGGIVSLVADIAEQVGRLNGARLERDVRLRRINRIRTIAGSLAIEGNTLSEEQITAILDGKTVLAPPRELQEARNAIAAYDRLPDWNGLHEADLLSAHEIMMRGLLDHPGSYRAGGVGVMGGGAVIHMAPPARQVPLLMSSLFDWLGETMEHPLIASSVFHYEFEFIHPFSDGNGRMGRLWQTLLLSRWKPAFEWLPVESLVYQHQAGYYRALSESTEATDCAPFIHFMLQRIREAVVKVGKTPLKTPLKTPDAILGLLAGKPDMSIPQIAIGLRKSESAIKRAIRGLRESGQLRRVGPDKGGSWEVIRG
ncbi:MAG: Fic family protein [Gemmatimonadota bacterium]|jgi:Fic family protein|nr:Fic family protein [Gemmatimonadota bacterium]